MPCSDSSSSITIRLDGDEKFAGYEYAKITCGREINGGTNFSRYCVGMTLSEILELPYDKVAADLRLNGDEEKFILYLEWDALRSAAGLYLGVESEHIDTSRCAITSIEHTDEGIEIAEVILPPRELPKILPCSMGAQEDHSHPEKV